MFRSEEETLRARLKEAEQERDACRQENERLRKLRPFWDAFMSRASGTLLTLVVLALAGAAYVSCETAENRRLAAERQGQIVLHQLHLQEMRDASPPEGVSSVAWLWCIDHCARYQSLVPGHFMFEGIITGRLGTTIEVDGPWVHRAENQTRRFEADLPSGISIGSVVRVTEDCTNQGVTGSCAVVSVRESPTYREHLAR